MEEEYKKEEGFSRVVINCWTKIREAEGRVRCGEREREKEKKKERKRQGEIEREKEVWGRGEKRGDFG